VGEEGRRKRRGKRGKGKEEREIVEKIKRRGKNALLLAKYT